MAFRTHLPTGLLIGPRTEPQLLRPGEALLSFYFGQADSFVWAVPKEGPVAFAAAPLTALIAAAAAVISMAIGLLAERLLFFP